MLAWANYRGIHLTRLFHEKDGTKLGDWVAIAPALTPSDHHLLGANHQLYCAAPKTSSAAYSSTLCIYAYKRQRQRNLMGTMGTKSERVELGDFEVAWSLRENCTSPAPEKISAVGLPPCLIIEQTGWEKCGKLPRETGEKTTQYRRSRCQSRATRVYPTV